MSRDGRQLNPLRNSAQREKRSDGRCRGLHVRENSLTASAPSEQGAAAETEHSRKNPFNYACYSKIAYKDH